MTPQDEVPERNHDVRAIVLGEHSALRDRLDEIDRCLVQVAAGSGQAYVEVREHFRSLLVAFLRHLEHEEALLSPLLRYRQAWGPLRLEQLKADHLAQRLQVAELEALDPDTTAAEWASRMRKFSSELRADMGNEEHDFVHPNSLELDEVLGELIARRRR